MLFKKQLINLVVRKLNDRKLRKKMRYGYKGITDTFWWYLGKKLQDQQEIDDVYYGLAKFFKNYHGAEDSLFESFEINDMIILNGRIYVYVGRPGFFIGRGGSNINFITDLINNGPNGKVIHNFEFEIIEDNTSWRRHVATYLTMVYGE